MKARRKNKQLQRQRQNWRVGQSSGALELVPEPEGLPDELRPHPGVWRYWMKRNYLFPTRELKLDPESWAFCTPEKIAEETAKFCASKIQTGGTVLDPFCGCGGNVIHFARFFNKVIAIEKDPLRLELCRENAKLYGVENKITFILGDFLDYVKSPILKDVDMVFLSPPWGGVEYNKEDKFDIETMPLNGKELFELAQTISKEIAFFLPKNVDRHQVRHLTREGSRPKFVENHLKVKTNKRLKGITAYFGKLAKKASTDDGDKKDKLDEVEVIKESPGSPSEQFKY